MTFTARRPTPEQTPAGLVVPRPLLTWPGLREGAALCFAILWEAAGHRPESALRISKAAIGGALDVTSRSVERYADALAAAGLVTIRDCAAGRYLLEIHDPATVRQDLRTQPADPQPRLFSDSPAADQTTEPPRLCRNPADQTTEPPPANLVAPPAPVVPAVAFEQTPQHVTADRPAWLAAPPSGIKKQENNNTPRDKTQTQEQDNEARPLRAFEPAGLRHAGPQSIGQALRNSPLLDAQNTAANAREAWRLRILAAVADRTCGEWIAEDLAHLATADAIPPDSLERLIDRLARSRDAEAAGQAPAIADRGAYLNRTAARLARQHGNAWPQPHRTKGAHRP